MVVKHKTPVQFFKTVKNWFFTGLFMLLPLGITIIIVSLLLNYVGSPASQFLLDCFGLEIPDKFWMSTVINLFSTIFIVVIITVLGFLSKYFLGKTVFRLAERLIDRVPFVNSVYKTVKQVVETFSRNQDDVFQTTVLFEYPRKGIYTIGFMTSTGKGEVQEKTQDNMVNVFLPTTPNPTSGFLLIIPRADIILLDMSVSDGIKMIISGGVVNPQWLPKKELPGKGLPKKESQQKELSPKELPKKTINTKSPRSPKKKSST